MSGLRLGRPGARNRRSSIASSKFLFAGIRIAYLDAARLQRFVDRRPREGGVGPERDALSLGLLAVDLGHEPFLPVVRVGDVAGSQLRRHAVTVIDRRANGADADGYSTRRSCDGAMRGGDGETTSAPVTVRQCRSGHAVWIFLSSRRQSLRKLLRVALSFAFAGSAPNCR